MLSRLQLFYCKRTVKQLSNLRDKFAPFMEIGDDRNGKAARFCRHYLASQYEKHCNYSKELRLTLDEFQFSLDRIEFGERLFGDILKKVCRLTKHKKVAWECSCIHCRQIRYKLRRLNSEKCRIESIMSYLHDIIGILEYLISLGPSPPAPYCESQQKC